MYSLCDDYRCRDGYSVDAAGNVTQDILSSVQASYYRTASTIRYYEASTDSTRSLTLAEARQYRLDTSSKSPDGYSLIREETSSGFLFWGDYNEGWYLKNGAKKQRVELSTGGSYYSQDVKFLGWVNQ